MSDHLYLDWLRDGRPDQLEPLWAEIQPRLVRVACRIAGADLADDAVQNAALALLRAREQLPHGIPFVAVAVRLVQRSAQMARRSLVRRRRREITATQEAESISCEELSDTPEISTLLAGLNETDRTTLSIAAGIETCPQRVSYGTQRVRLHRLRLRLREHVRALSA